MELLSKAVPIAMLGFVVSSMLAVGLGLTLSQIAAPLRNVRLVALGLATNFVLMPLAAVALGRLLRLDTSFAVGLVILGSAAGAPFLPLLAKLSKGDMAFAVGLMVLLMILTVGYMPLVLPLLLEGVSVDAAEDRPLASAPHAAAARNRAGGEGALGAGGRADQAGPRPRVQPEPHPVDRSPDRHELRQDRRASSARAQSSPGSSSSSSASRSATSSEDRGARRGVCSGSEPRSATSPPRSSWQARTSRDPKVVVMVVVVAIVGLLLLMPLARVLARRA